MTSRRFLPLSATTLLAGAAALATSAGAADEPMLARVQARISLAAAAWCDRAAELGVDGTRRCVLDVKSIDDGVAPAAHAIQFSSSIALTRSILVSLDEDALAVVLGHEVAHLVLGHGLLRVRQELARLPPSQREPASAQAQLALQGLLESSQPAPHPQTPTDPRAQEFDADTLGLVFAVRAGYAAYAGARFFGRAASALPGWARGNGTTHPSLPARARALAALAAVLCQALKDGKPLLPNEERLLPQAEHRREEARAARLPAHGAPQCET